MSELLSLCVRLKPAKHPTTTSLMTERHFGLPTDWRKTRIHTHTRTQKTHQTECVCVGRAG